ncbi:uncharacterized protein LOC127788310 isoform X2 [Diospyros lotus]|uniref:uncharacterized protein LOC127788310 isoform X2 n=1 Tax=Diospyros lotus TaxID=55363 RepID=UPI00224FF966|nr:uncharacterized protein LOC127788310 isoform X2 [Diospyros lotus]
MDSSLASSLRKEMGGPAEDVVQALLDYLLDPVLPFKSIAHVVPSLSEQQLVSKQVLALVLLYNYYQRKRHLEVEFLGFESFCKLAVILKPALIGYMKLMHRSDYVELDDLEDHLSMTEKAVMNACDIALSLDASKDAPSIEGWPATKAAILLTDSSGDNCLLQFSSITHGVWSLIEKELDVSSQGKHTNNRKRNMRKPLRDEVKTDKGAFEQLVLSAVKEVTGINQSDLLILESHCVYALNKEKEAAHFYIIQCTKSFIEGTQLPVKDVIESLQGPLVRRSSRCWTVTPVVQYFHMLPYAGVLTEWYSRKVFSNSLGDLRVKLQDADAKHSQTIANLCDKVATEGTDDFEKNINGPNSVNKKGSKIITESLRKGDCDTSAMDVDDSATVNHQNENRSKSKCNLTKFYHYQRRMSTSADSTILAKGSCFKVEMGDSVKTSCVSKFRDEKADAVNKSMTLSSQDELPIRDRALIPFKLSSKHLEKLEVTLTSKENALQQAALRFLLNKRTKLSCQLRDLEADIVACDRSIQTISDGVADDLALKIEAIIDEYSDVFLKVETETQEKTCQYIESQGSSQRRGKRLSEAVLTLPNSSQWELDNICYENNWTLPTYHVSPADGGFQASVSVAGEKFQLSAGSHMKTSPRLARESAAAELIAKLQSQAQGGGGACSS